MVLSIVKFNVKAQNSSVGFLSDKDSAYSFILSHMKTEKKAASVRNKYELIGF